MKQNKLFLFLLAGLLIAAISRLFPHPANFTPLAAMALFGGTYFVNKKWSLIVPMLCLLFSDFLLQVGHWLGYYEFAGFHALMPAVYASFALIVLVGWYLQKRLGVINVIMGTLIGATLFFLLTNFAVWIMYMPKTQAALIQCYVQAIPFFRNALLGDLCYVAIMFGSFEWMKKTYLIPSKSKV